MASTRLRAAAALFAASATLLTLTACAPPVSLSTSAPTASSTTGATPSATPTPVVKPLAEPASRYSIGCSDLIPSSGVSSLFTVPMTEVDTAVLTRLNLLSGLEDAYLVQDLGGIDCTWYDGQKTSDSSHSIQLDVLPVTTAQWDKLIKGGETDVHNGKIVDCESDSQNDCEYDNYVNGSRIYLEISNMVPTVGSNPEVLPAAVQAVVNNIESRLESTTIGPVPAPQQPSITLPTSGTAMLTANQARTALGLKPTAKMTVDCTGAPDGPWSIESEAETEIDGSLGCSFGPPYDGGGAGPYGYFEWIPAGQWVATKLETDTPTEAAVSVPGLPAGDSFEEFLDYNNEHTGDLVIGGNLIEFDVSKGTAAYEPVATVPLSQAIVTLAEDFETTIRSHT